MNKIWSGGAPPGPPPPGGGAPARIREGPHNPHGVFVKLCASLGMASNLLAHHLKTLEDGGLVTRRRSEGDGRRSYLSLIPSRRMAGCRRRVPSPVPAARRVVFVCTANTARSHLAASAWRRVSAIPATSAGTHPGERIHPGAITAAERRGLDLPAITPASPGGYGR